MFDRFLYEQHYGLARLSVARPRLLLALCPVRGAQRHWCVELRAWVFVSRIVQ